MKYFCRINCINVYLETYIGRNHFKGYLKNGGPYMMKKLYEFLLVNSMFVMLIGFAVALGGLLVYMQTRYMGSFVPQFAFGVTIAGFVIYIVGRVLVAAQRRRKSAAVHRDSNV